MRPPISLPGIIDELADVDERDSDVEPAAAPTAVRLLGEHGLGLGDRRLRRRRRVRSPPGGRWAACHDSVLSSLTWIVGAMRSRRSAVRMRLGERHPSAVTSRLGPHRPALAGRLADRLIAVDRPAGRSTSSCHSSVSLKEVMAAIGDAVGRPEEAAELVARLRRARRSDRHDARRCAGEDEAGHVQPGRRRTVVPAVAGMDRPTRCSPTPHVIVVPADATGAIDPIMQPFLDAPLVAGPAWRSPPAPSFPAPSGTSSLGMGRSCSRRSTRSSRGWRRSPAERCRQAAALGRDAGRSGLLVSAAVYLNEFADDLAPEGHAGVGGVRQPARERRRPRDPPRRVGALRVAPGGRARHALPLHRVGRSGRAARAPAARRQPVVALVGPRQPAPLRPLPRVRARPARARRHRVEPRARLLDGGDGGRRAGVHRRPAAAAADHLRPLDGRAGHDAGRARGPEGRPRPRARRRRARAVGQGHEGDRRVHHPQHRVRRPRRVPRERGPVRQVPHP